MSIKYASAHNAGFNEQHLKEINATLNFTQAVFTMECHWLVGACLEDRKRSLHSLLAELT